MLEKLQNIRAVFSPLTAFFIGTLFTCSAYGLLSSYLALRLNGAHVPMFYTGIIMSVYYVGYIFATLSSYKIINRVGHIRAFSAYISILSALVLLHAVYFNPLYWGILRLSEGYCLASSLMCLESWLNTRSNNKNRGIIMSVYMVTTYLGSAFGQLFLNIPDPQGFVLLIVVSFLYSVALVPISLTALPTPDISRHKAMSLRELHQKAPMGVVGCIVSGVFVGSVYVLGAIYAQKSGLDISRTSLFMFFCILGGMSAQIPVGRLSDKMDRRFIMMWISGGLFVVAPWLHFFMTESVWELAAASLLLGSGVFVLYPICVSHVNDMIDDDARTEASGLLIMLQSVGMIAGPVIISFLMQVFGSMSFLVSFSVVSGAFVLYALKNVTFRPDVGYIAVTKTDPVPMMPTHVFTKITQDDTLLDKAKSLFVEKKS